MMHQYPSYINTPVRIQKVFSVILNVLSDSTFASKSSLLELGEKVFKVHFFFFPYLLKIELKNK